VGAHAGTQLEVVVRAEPERSRGRIVIETLAGESGEIFPAVRGALGLRPMWTETAAAGVGARGVEIRARRFARGGLSDVARNAARLRAT